MQSLFKSINETTELVFYYETNDKLDNDELKILEYLLQSTTKPTITTNYIEVGPRLTFETPWCTNVLTIIRRIGITKVLRIEKFIRTIQKKIIPHFDSMTMTVYNNPLTTFQSNIKPNPPLIIPIDNIEKYSQKMGLGWDKDDILYYKYLFKLILHRDPTDVELYDLAQSNSEHSRHTFFNARMVIDGIEQSESLFDLVKKPERYLHKKTMDLFMNGIIKQFWNSRVAFEDNASAITGYDVNMIIPRSNKYTPIIQGHNPIFTAETHNFPTGVAPFHGAATGVGGRIRDIQAMGKGGRYTAGIAGYCVADIPYLQPHSPFNNFKYPTNIASSKEIIIEASNGASDYGNKFGEPLIQGFVRSYSTIFNNERREWIKPIMFTGGVGYVNEWDTFKNLSMSEPEEDTRYLIVKVGGPAYRIGLGGGTSSSVDQGINDIKRDINAVQRGDPEMEQKMNRLLWACIDNRPNPIKSIHDQGAGGNGNVIKELVYDFGGGTIDISKITRGDPSMSSLEVWSSEYQEQNALIIDKENKELLETMARRENVPIDFIGHTNYYAEKKGSRMRVIDKTAPNGWCVDLPLDEILKKVPKRKFELQTIQPEFHPIQVPQFNPKLLTESIKGIFGFLSIGSKRYLTNKVDRSVTGLIAQQQCVGPFHTPLANVAITALSHFDVKGTAIAIGEQPIKGFLSTEASARMSVGEMMTNIMWAKVNRLEDIKISGNWMWPAKHPGEGVELYKAAKALSEFLCEVGIAIDGGKDSLSMSANVGNQTVKCPRSLVISGYVTCPDVRCKVTPDLKSTKSYLLLIRLSSHLRLGGSAFSRFISPGKMVGSLKDCPDIENPEYLRIVFNTIQDLIEKKLILSGHDISDGGLITTVLEMVISGGKGLDLEIKEELIFPYLFAEELGVVIEVHRKNALSVYEILKEQKINYEYLGKTKKDRNVSIKNNAELIFEKRISLIRDWWEKSSFKLELLQSNEKCVRQEWTELFNATKGPKYHSSMKNNFKNLHFPGSDSQFERKHKVAILREEGSNGDREMAAAFYIAGFDVYDVTMTDLESERINLSDFKGIAFVGGFSFSDVLGAARGWYACIKFNLAVRKQFDDFYQRDDTFSLGVCNGCQLMALLGWIPSVQLTPNKSGRFESRFSTVKILPNN